METFFYAVYALVGVRGLHSLVKNLKRFRRSQTCYNKLVVGFSQLVHALEGYSVSRSKAKGLDMGRVELTC